MLKIINECLCNFNLENCNSDLYGDFVKIAIQSSSEIVKTSEDTQKIVPNIRTLAKIISPDKCFSKYNMSFSTKTSTSEKGTQNTQLLFKCTPDVQKDSLVYMIAFPFNGIVKPIPESNNYRILKGMVSTSEQYSVHFNGKKYKKILYLAVSPRVSVFTSETDSIQFRIESYAHYRDKDSSKDEIPTTVRETLALDIYSAERHSVKLITEEIEPVNIDMYKNQPIFITYQKQERTERAHNKESNIRVRYINTNSRSENNSGGYTKPIFNDKNDNDGIPKKKSGGNPKRKKKTKPSNH